MIEEIEDGARSLSVNAPDDLQQQPDERDPTNPEELSQTLGDWLKS